MIKVLISLFLAIVASYSVAQTSSGSGGPANSSDTLVPATLQWQIGSTARYTSQLEVACAPTEQYWRDSYKDILASNSDYSIYTYYHKESSDKSSWTCDANLHHISQNYDTLLQRTQPNRTYMCDDGVTPPIAGTNPPMCHTNPPLCTDTNKYLRRFDYHVKPFVAPVEYEGCAIAVDEVGDCYTGKLGAWCNVFFHKTGVTYKGPDLTQSGGSPDGDPSTDGSRTPSPPFVNQDPGGGPQKCSNCPPCPSGTSQVGIDSTGIPICQGPGTKPDNGPTPPPVTTKPPVTTTDDQGNTKTVQETVQQNADGSQTTTTTTTVKGSDGSTTVTVSKDTSKASDGKDGKQDSTSDKDGLCKQNPNLTICRNSSVSGTCGEITCSGDAIQCATLQAAAKMQCKQQQDDDDLKANPRVADGDATLAGNDAMKGEVDGMLKGETVDVSASAIDQGAFLPSSCIGDKTFTVAGHSISYSFASLCANVQPLRYVFMAIAFLIVYLTLARSSVGGGS